MKGRFHYQEVSNKSGTKKIELDFNFYFIFNNVLCLYSFYFSRPRAEELCSADDLKIGQVVFVNYNMEEGKERGLW